MLTIGDFNSFGVFLGHPVLSYYRVSKKKLMLFQIQISCEFHYGVFPMGIQRTDRDLVHST